MDVLKFVDYHNKVVENCSKVIVGKDDVISLVLTSFVCGGHVLLEDIPGTGKTMLLRAFAKTIGGDFKRIQFTPDLLPSDLTGINFYNQKTGEFEFRPGPLFSNIILADEINRATPRTQSSLLEAMEEKQITVDGVTTQLEPPFMVMATQNPLESYGTFPLPDAQMDRFFMRLSLGYMTRSQEMSVLGRKDSVSIIEDLPGVTRDRIYQEATYNKKKFYLIDTGGIDATKMTFNDEIKMQAEIAIKDADIVVFIVDGKEGLTANDLIVRDILRKSQKKVIVAINKIDVKDAKDNIYDFYELGFDTYIPISSIHNTGYVELMDTITNGFHEHEEKVDSRLKFSIIGRPNVGKSSLMNALLNEERVVVSNIAGTTRDSIDSVLKYHNEEYILIDTAGMRKKGKVFESVEKYSLVRSLKSIDRSDICLVVINAEEGITEHDKHIAGYAIERGKGLIFVVNKWDTVKETTIQEFEKLMRAEFQFATYAPIVFLSALTKKRIHTLMPEVLKVAENISKEIKTSILNEVINDAYQLNLPPSYKGKRLKIYFTSQTGTKPPKFTFRVNNKGLVHFSYERYLENKIRENFDLEGTPIVLEFKNKGE